MFKRRIFTAILDDHDRDRDRDTLKHRTMSCDRFLSFIMRVAMYVIGESADSFIQSNLHCTLMQL